MKRFIPILLVLCILCAAFASCSGDEPNSDIKNTGDGNNSEQDSLGDADERGYEYLPEKDLNYNWRLLMIDSEAKTIFKTEEKGYGDAVSQAFFERDAWMMERYNITMESIAAGTRIAPWLTTNALSGDDLYDIGVLHTVDQMASVISENLTYDIKQLPYVDLSMPYYNQQANEEYTIFGKQVMMNGDYPYCGGTMAYFLFNKTMMDELGLEYPYKLVMNGDWTMEVFYEYCENAYRDVDDVSGKSEGDIFGYAGCVPTTFFAGMGGTLLTKDENGAIMPSIVSDFNEQRYAKVVELMNQSWCYAEKKLDIDKNLYGTIQWFEGRTLFHYFQRYSSDLMGIEDFDYGLAALPKYDEDQENYVAPAAGGVSIIGANIRDPETVGYILEAFGQITYELLRPAQIEQKREHRILRDSESLEVYKMLQSQCMVFSITKNIDPSNVMASDQIITDCLQDDRPSLSAYAKNLEEMVKRSYRRFYYGS